MKKTLNIKGQLLELNGAKVMAILNLTPDSFYDGGMYTSEKEILQACTTFIEQGATFIDVGASSTRPGADLLTPDQEIKRLSIILPKLKKEFPKTYFSIDTIHVKTAKYALDHGFDLLNDIFGGRANQAIFDLAAEYKVPYIGMHSIEKPKNMQDKPLYLDGVLEHMKFYFIELQQKARAKGINDLILDPGFGFGKTLQDNYTILNHLDVIKTWFECPILVGVSRKSMIYKLLKSTAQTALNGTSAIHSIALLKGADILRVHDVKEAVECIAIYQQLKSCQLKY